MAAKNYVGSGWEKTFQDDSTLINLKLKFDELIKLPTNHYGEIAITVCRRKEPDPKSKATHYVIEDTYSGPAQSSAEQPATPLVDEGTEAADEFPW